MLKPHLHQCWCIPPENSCEFVAAMEDILDVYVRPYDPTRPVVCMDETSKQLVADIRIPIAAKPGHPQRYDVEYSRCGVANVFMFTEPLVGWRRVSVTNHRKRPDWAKQVRILLEEDYPDLTDRLIAFGQPPPNSADFVLYRLLTGLTEAIDLAMLCIDACFWLRRTLL